MSKLLILKTKSGNKYIYDNGSNEIIPYSDIKYDLLQNFKNKSEQELLSILNKKYTNISYNKIKYEYDYINNLYSNKVIIDEKEKIYDLQLNKLKNFFFNSSIFQLILVITEECNLRCEYCIYSNKYPNIKTYTSNFMSKDIAFKSIDYYMELFDEKVKRGFDSDPVISFYGGEPLLNFTLIKEIVAYCKEKYSKYKIKYNFTTNGILLNEEIINFILRNNMLVTFSLDGDKEEHDRKRKFNNKKGSFDIVYNNIVKFQEKNSLLKEKIKINFNCCYDNETNLVKVLDFYKKHENLFNPFHVSFNKIIDFNTSYYDDKKDDTVLEESLNLLKDKYINNIINKKNIDPCIESLFRAFPLMKHRFKGEESFLNNSCFPGGKMCIDYKGNIYMCERINQQLAIGNVNEGLNWSNIKLYIEKFIKVYNENCKKCNISRLCPVCFSILCKDEDIKINKEYCKKQKKSLKKIMEEMYSILELNKSAFDKL